MTAIRSDLRTRARARADQDASDFPSDAQYNAYLDESRREVWLDLVKAGWQLNYTSTTITATGATSYQITNTGAVFSVEAVYWVQGTTFYQMNRLDPSFKAEILSNASQPALYYELMMDPTQGVVVRFYPAASSGTYRVDWVPEIPAFISDADTWYGPVASDELLVLRAAMKGMLKEGRAQDAAAMEGEYQRLLPKVADAANFMDQRNVARIRDVNRTAVRDPFAYPVVGPDTGLQGWP